MNINETRLETLLTTNPLKKEITVYHGSIEKVNIIYPKSINYGTKLSKERASSFWCPSYEFVRWFAFGKLINKLGYRTYRGINGNYLVRPSDYDDIIKKLKGGKLYIYEKTIPKEYLGIGHSRYEEYTVDLPVKPDKVYTETYTKFKDLIKSIEKLDTDDYKNSKMIKDLKNTKLKKSFTLNNINTRTLITKSNKELGNDMMKIYDDLMQTNESFIYNFYNESLVFNNNDLYWNFEKFKSGESNILLITGLSGSGKSTIGRQLASKYKAEYIELDCIGDVKENSKPEILQKWVDTLNDKELKELNRDPYEGEYQPKFLDYCIRYANSNKDKKFIIEGIQIYELYKDKARNYPLIIKGTSVIKSFLQKSIKREKWSYKEFLKYTKEDLSWLIKSDKDLLNLRKSLNESFIYNFYNELKSELEQDNGRFFMITPSNDKDDLDNQLNKFNAQDDDEKELSDHRSIALYGKTNYDHYTELISKLTKGTKDDQLNGLSYNKDDKLIKENTIYITEGIRSGKQLNLNIQYAMDFNTHHTDRVIMYPCLDQNILDSLYSKYMMIDSEEKLWSDNKAHELFGLTNREIYKKYSDIISGKIKDNNNQYESDNTEEDKSCETIFSNDLPLVTPDELNNKIEENYDCFNKEDGDKIKLWRESYSLLGQGIKIKDYNKYNLDRINILRKAIYENNNEAILQCGWIPGIEFTSENRVLASNIIREKMNINTDVISYNCIEEASDNKEDVKAVSIVLISGNSTLGNIIKKVQHNEFSHASISLDDDLKRIYSFNMRNGFDGLAYESMKQYVKEGVQKVGVYTFLVSNEVYKQLEKTLDNFSLYINKTKYSILNLLTIPLHIPLDMDMKMVCSEFVDKLLKSANLDITNKKSMFVSPKDFSDKVKNNAKIVEVFKGNPKDYNSSKIKNRISKLKRSNIGVYEFVEYDDIAITEAKSFPIQFDKDGNLLLKNIKRIDFEQEYTNSHRLLMEYAKQKSYDPMKFELAKMQFFITLLEKKIYKQGKEKSVDELKVRARFLNDFKKYLKLVVSNDKTFNFAEYYEKSPFNDAIIQIDNSTLKYGWKALKHLIFENTIDEYEIDINKS